MRYCEKLVIGDKITNEMMIKRLNNTKKGNNMNVNKSFEYCYFSRNSIGY